MAANVMLTSPASQTTPPNIDDPAIRMKPQPEPSTQEVLAGLVERVTFHNVENGFCVLRAKARGHRELVTVIGHAAIISAGEWITATGDWVNDRTHGQQFKARFLRTSTPTSADGIEKYLSSGMIRGVGPAYAKKLVRAFGEKVFDVIEATPDRLREVDGIGPVRAASILAAWAEQKAVREIMVFLHSHGVGTARAVRIFKTYGADAIQVMTENPYRLARDIRGIGFRTADTIAMRLGIEKTAMVRVRAGISYALTEAMDEGHCGLSTEELMPLAESPRRGSSAPRLNRRLLSLLGRARKHGRDTFRIDVEGYEGQGLVAGIAPASKSLCPRLYWLPCRTRHSTEPHPTDGVGRGRAGLSGAPAFVSFPAPSAAAFSFAAPASGEHPCRSKRSITKAITLSAD
jgi:hypothetical protein